MALLLGGSCFSPVVVACPGLLVCRTVCGPRGPPVPVGRPTPGPAAGHRHDPQESGGLRGGVWVSCGGIKAVAVGA